MVFNLDFAKHTTLLCFFFFSLIIDLSSFVPAVIAKSFNPITELVIPIGKPIKDAKIEIEVHPVIVEANIGKCLI